MRHSSPGDHYRTTKNLRPPVSRALLENVLNGKLKDARAVQRADDLQSSKARMRNQVAGLVQGLAIAARWTCRRVLNGVDSVAVLYVVVGVIQQVEGLGLEKNRLPLCEREAPRDAEINLLRPGTVERVQSGDRAGSTAIDPKCGIGGRLQSRSIVDAVGLSGTPR